MENEGQERRTLMMCSLGSRLQSASVRSGPSRKLRVDTPGSSTLLASISSTTGVCKYSSNLFRDFRRAFSRPTPDQNRITGEESRISQASIKALKLTLISFFTRVLDVGRKLGKYIYSCCVGFWMLCCQLWVS